MSNTYIYIFFCMRAFSPIVLTTQTQTKRDKNDTNTK